MIEGSVHLPQRPVWDVAALLVATGELLHGRFGAVLVRGELSGVTRAASGHRYFSLKDLAGSGALLRCALFRRSALLLDFDVADGQQVELRGRLAIFEPRGELQLIVESMQRLGAGALYEQFLRLKARLAAEGLFDTARKRMPPRWPATLGIVTSTASAALHDVLVTLRRRAPQLRIVVYPSAVQGAEAAASLVAALRLAATRREVDALLLVRGGGSLQDLWSFNDEALVRAIAASPMPVICGVGHESDLTLADLAADVRAATPTAAAELAAPARAEALSQLDALGERLVRRLRQCVDTQAQRLDALTWRLGGPARALATQRHMLISLEQRMSRAPRQALATTTREHAQWGARLLRAGQAQRAPHALRMQAAAQRLAALDPQRVLARGFAWIENADGEAVVSARSVASGDRLRAVWHDGAAQVRVEQVQPRPDGESAPAA